MGRFRNVFESVRGAASAFGFLGHLACDIVLEVSREAVMGRARPDPSRAEALALLGLTPAAAPAQVSMALHKLAAFEHPDANPGDVAAAGRYQDVQAAGRVLLPTALLPVL